MLIFKEMAGNLNIIHIVYGDETELQLDISGHIIVDLNDKIESNKKNILYINRCRNEELIQNNLDIIMEKMGFHLPPAMDKKKKINNDTLKSKMSNQTHNNKLSKINKDIKCPKCSEYGCIVTDGVPGLCPSCELIESGLKLNKSLSAKKKKRIRKKKGETNE